MRTALAVSALLLLAACGGGGKAAEPAPETTASPQSPAVEGGDDGMAGLRGVADQIGCTGVKVDRNNLGNVPALNCKIGRERVAITDWSGVSNSDKDHLWTMLTGSMGYNLVMVTDDLTVTTQTERTAKAVQAAAGGNWLPALD